MAGASRTWARCRPPTGCPSSGPATSRASPLPFERQPLLAPLRAGRPAHARALIAAADGTNHQVETSGLPIIGTDGFQGALIFFWPVEEDEA